MNNFKCPVCENQRLTNHNFKGTPIDICDNCGGLWLDKGELNAIAHPITGDIEFCSQEHVGEVRLSGINCPKCEGQPLHKTQFIEFTDISLDHCPKCNGLWLDKAELDAINREIDTLIELPESWEHKIMIFISKLPF